LYFPFAPAIAARLFAPPFVIVHFLPISFAAFQSVIKHSAILRRIPIRRN
jgi:hypothetical protein